MARKEAPAEKHAGKHPGSENLQPAPPFSSNNQPAPERRSGGRRPFTTATRRHFADEKELLSLMRAVIVNAKRGNGTALDRLLDALDGPRTQRHVVAGVDLSGADDATLDALENILERIPSAGDAGSLPDA